MNHLSTESKTRSPNMARLAFAFTIIVFLFSVTHARLPANFPENDVITTDPTITVPESDAKSLIKFPSEKAESKPVVIDDLVSESQTGEWVESTPVFAAEPKSESKSGDSVEVIPVNEPGSELKSEESMESLPVSEIASENQKLLPVTVVLRPIHRHFDRLDGKRPSGFGFGFRFPRRCDHHFKRNGQRAQRHEFSYGNDMIMPREKMESGADHNPARWVRFHVKPMQDTHFGHRHGHDFVISEEDERMTHHFHRRHHHHHHHLEDEEEEERERREGGGLMKRIRKFLNHF